MSDPLALTGSDAVNQVSDKLRHVIAFSITFWYVLESGGWLAPVSRGRGRNSTGVQNAQDTDQPKRCLLWQSVWAFFLGALCKWCAAQWSATDFTFYARWLAKGSGCLWYTWPKHAVYNIIEVTFVARSSSQEWDDHLTTRSALVQVMKYTSSPSRSSKLMIPSAHLPFIILVKVCRPGLPRVGTAQTIVPLWCMFVLLFDDIAKSDYEL